MTTPVVIDTESLDLALERVERLTAALERCTAAAKALSEALPECDDDLALAGACGCAHGELVHGELMTLDDPVAAKLDRLITAIEKLVKPA